MKEILLIALLFCSINVFAQNEPQKIIDEFFRLYKEKDSNTAVDFIFSTNKWMSDAVDQIEDVKSKLRQTIKQLGPFYGYDLITKKTFTNNLYLYSFMVRHDRQPLRFTLVFYNPDNQWQLQNFSYDYNFAEELEEAAKPYRLKENINN